MIDGELLVLLVLVLLVLLGVTLALIWREEREFGRLKAFGVRELRKSSTAVLDVLDVLVGNGGSRVGLSSALFVFMVCFRCDVCAPVCENVGLDSLSSVVDTKR